MKENQKGFGLVEGLLVIIAVTLIVGVGYVVSNNSKSNKKSNTAAVAQDSTAKASLDKQPLQSEAEKAATLETDKKLVSLAVKQYTGIDGHDDQSNATVTVTDVVGDNARGSFFESGVGGASFVAHKDTGVWQVVFEGQQGVSAEIGKKYNLPTDWYVSSN